MYDAKHDMYHVFFQDHLALPGGSGPVTGGRGGLTAKSQHRYRDAHARALNAKCI